jgi:hypothetical protein
MKKLFLLLTGAAMLTFVNAGAAVKTADAKKAAVKITVDGVLDEAAWATATKYNVETPFKGEAILGGAADCSGFFQVLWADSGVFVAVSVTDDIRGITVPATTWGPAYGQDLVEVYFDMNVLGLRDGKGPEIASSGHFSNTEYGIDTVRKGTGFIAAYKHNLTTPTNYIKEVYYAWSALKNADGVVYKPSSKIPLGFDITITDNDKDTVEKARSFRNRLVWSNKGDVKQNYNNMDDAGLLTFSDAPAVNVVKEAIAKKATAAVVVDGNLTESVWTSARKYDVRTEFKGEAILGGFADCSGYFQTAWSDSGVFVAVTVTDDIKGITVPAETWGKSWAQDLVEVYFDMNTWGFKDGKGPGTAGSGHIGNSEYGIDTVRKGTGFVAAYKHNATVPTNYVKEVYYAWSALKNVDGKIYKPNVNVPLGFDITITDNDKDTVEKARNFRNRLVWSNKGDIGENYNNMDDAGFLKFEGASTDAMTDTAKKTTVAIKIDGVLDESAWAGAYKNRLGRTFKGEVIKNTTDCSGFFQTLWADSGLFVAVTVVDDVKGYSKTKYGPFDWAQDLTEIYIDMNVGNLKDGKGSSYSKGHFQNAIVAPSGTDTIVKSNGVTTSYKRGTAGNYIKEVYLPWSYLKDSSNNLYTSNVKPIGFDVYVSDNDVDSVDKGTNFRNRLVWSNKGDVNENYNNMNEVGLLYLSGSPVITSIATASSSVGSFLVYPNPAENFIVLKTNNSGTYAVLNIAGQSILSGNVSNSQIDISRLQKGVYFVKVGNQTAKFIKK